VRRQTRHLPPVVGTVDAAVPLCVDLGALIRTDLLPESLMVLIKRNPLYLLRLPLWLVRGRSALKTEVAGRVELDPAALAYDRDLLRWLADQRHTGRALWLCTAANGPLAERVAAFLGVFDGVLAGNDGARLVERFGEGGFDYCGNEPSPAGTLRALFQALRPHQWAKNLLLLAPLLAAHRLNVPGSLLDGLLGVAAFCLGASSVYIVNDLLDLKADRAHPRKFMRPFASGRLSILTGWWLAPALLAGALGIGAVLPARFELVFMTYYVATLAYSFFLKGRVIVDAMTLAGLYTLRVIAGAAAVTVALSFWMLLFSVFLFLSLALVKRFAELDAMRRQQQLRATGRGYRVEDLPVLQSLGTASAYMSVLVLALYINSPDIQSLYHRPKVIWMLCILQLYWVTRVWLLTQRGAMHDDPVVFALKDPVSLGVGLAAALTVLLAV